MKNRFLLVRQVALLALTLAMESGWGATAPTVQRYSIRAEHGSLEFNAVGKPSMIRIKGESKSGPEGEITISNKQVSGTLQFRLDSLRTGLETRDNHMKAKYLQTAKYPKSSLKITKFVIDDMTKSMKGEFNGDLELHGETQPVRGSIDYQASKQESRIHAEFKINISKFKIPVPNYLGITVAEEVTVKLDFKLTEANL